jgi:hypothetical protein
MSDNYPQMFAIGLRLDDLFQEAIAGGRGGDVDDEPVGDSRRFRARVEDHGGHSGEADEVLYLVDLVRAAPRSLPDVLGPSFRGRCLVIGLSTTPPDSFFDGGRYLAAASVVAHGLKLARSGADIIDVGGESTRPGAVLGYRCGRFSAVERTYVRAAQPGVRRT